MTTRKLRLLAVSVAVAAMVAGRSLPVSARDDHLKFPIAPALGTPDAKAKLDPKIALYFGKAAHPSGADLGTFTTNKKTNAVGKTDQVACEWVFLSALIALQERARQLQATAVVGIESIYKNDPFSSETEFMCGAGSFVAGVALRGQFIRAGGK
ncbi:MAG TPA: excinuclease ABC subunit A [Polyangia bacterium]|nr:excinuclease ABC subunit A [Polyangia bacterium]